MYALERRDDRARMFLAPSAKVPSIKHGRELWRQSNDEAYICCCPVSALQMLRRALLALLPLVGSGECHVFSSVTAFN